MDTSGTEASDEETCSKFIPLEEFLPASINEPEAEWTSPVQQDKDMQNDPSLILCTRYTELPSNLDQSDTTYKTFCLFPETKKTHKLQTKNQQMHTAFYQSSSVEPCYSNPDDSAVPFSRVGLDKKQAQTKASSAQVIRPTPKLTRHMILAQNQSQNTHQQSFSAFIRDLAEPQEVVEIELAEKIKDKKLRRTRGLAPKSSFNKRKNVMKVRSVAANISDGEPNLLAMKVTSTHNNTPLQDTISSPVIESSSVGKNHNYASMDDETNDKHLHLPPLLNPQSSPQTSAYTPNESANGNNHKIRKLKLLQASGSVANTMEDCDSSDSLNSGIQQGNIRFQITSMKHPDIRFDSEKETQEMIQDAVALGLGNPQELKGYEEGIMRNIDREVDEWTSVNQL
jgi:hypothetical protein